MRLFRDACVQHAVMLASSLKKLISIDYVCFVLFLIAFWSVSLRQLICSMIL